MVSYPKRLEFSTPPHLARLLLFQQIRGTLNKQADILESLHRNVVRQMEGQVRSLDRLTKGLEENLKFNHSSLNESIRLILLEVAAAQDYLNVTASKEIKKVCGHSQYQMHTNPYGPHFWGTWSDAPFLGPLREGIHFFI